MIIKSNYQKLSSIWLSLFVFIYPTGVKSTQNSYSTLSEEIHKATPFTYESYQSSILCTASSSATPKTLEAIQAIVKHAVQNKLRVKALGNRHSITDIICTDGVAVIMSKINHFSYNPSTKIATVGGGAELIDFMEQLDTVGRSLTSIPTFGKITIGGATGTGAHGTILREFSTLSDQIVSVTVVDGLGNVRKVNCDEEDFKAFKLHLGLLGIVYEVEFKTVPQYKLEVRNVPLPDDILFRGEELIKDAMSNDKFSFWWYPQSKKVVLSFGNNRPMETPGNCEFHLVSEASEKTAQGLSLALEIMQSVREDVSFFLVENYSRLGTFLQVPGRTPIYTEEDVITPCLPFAVGKSHKMMTSFCKECAWAYGNSSFHFLDVSISIHLKDLPAALKTIQGIVNESLVAFPNNGILFRFVKGSSAYMSMSNGMEDVVDIEWNPTPRWDKTMPMLGVTAYQAMAMALIEKHDGRPHWGKNGLYYSNPAIIKKAFPEYKKFIEVMKKVDPHEVFMNEIGQRIKYGKNLIKLRPEMGLRCALNDACRCKSEADCGNGGQTDFTCGKFQGFDVCKRKDNFLDELKDAASRAAINSIRELGDQIEYVLESLKGYKVYEEMREKQKGTKRVE